MHDSRFPMVGGRFIFLIVFAEERIYIISGGQLHIRAIGKTSWANSRYENEWVASDEEVHRFLYAHQDEMDTDEVE